MTPVMHSKHLYVLTLFGYFGLFVLLVADITWIAPPASFPRALLLIVLGAPLLLPMRGLLHGRPYTFAWSSFLALIYLTIALTEAVAEPDMLFLAGTEALLSLLWFVGAVLYVRVRARERRAAAGTVNSSGK